MQALENRTVGEGGDAGIFSHVFLTKSHLCVRVYCVCDVCLRVIGDFASVLGCAWILMMPAVAEREVVCDSLGMFVV